MRWKDQHTMLCHATSPCDDGLHVHWARDETRQDGSTVLLCDGCPTPCCQGMYVGSKNILHEHWSFSLFNLRYHDPSIQWSSLSLVILRRDQSRRHLSPSHEPDFIPFHCIPFNAIRICGPGYLRFQIFRLPKGIRSHLAPEMDNKHSACFHSGRDTILFTTPGRV